MSVGFIGSKHTVYDIYPLRNKKVFLLVDPQNILGSTADFRATLETITHLLKKDASVVLASSFGPLTGILLNLSRKEREGALEAFSREGGMGYTNFFSNLAPATKLEILGSIPGLQLSREMGKSSPNTGKTTLFAGLPNEVKVRALKHFFPKEEFTPCSSFPFVDALQEHLPGTKVHFSPDCVRAPLHTVAPAEVMVLENLRFYKNETSPEQEERAAMAEVLASGVDLFINDSFGTAYGVNASNVELPRLMQHGAAGYSMDRELAFYSKFLNRPGRPLAVIIAGTNVAGKLQLIRRLVGRVDRILVAGDVAFPFLAARHCSCGLGYPLDDEPTVRVNLSGGGSPGVPHASLTAMEKLKRRGAAAANGAADSVGGSSPTELMTSSAKGSPKLSSYTDADAVKDGEIPHLSITGSSAGKNGSGNMQDSKGKTVTAAAGGGSRDEVPCSVYAAEILKLCEQLEVDLILPIDHIVAANPDGDQSRAVLVESAAVPADVYAMDCGVNTINLFERSLRGCRTVFWTGALGCASKGYNAGTTALANVLGQSNILTIVGGRYTAQTVIQSGVSERILHISSGGISSLEVLQGNPLPGVLALSDVAQQLEVSSVSVNELLRNLPMFMGCSSHQLKVVAQKFVRRVHSKGDYLVYRGDRNMCLTVVAQGGLLARYGEEYVTLPTRYIPKGQTVGTYDFITQAVAVETVRAAQDDTVVYQLSSSALNELLNGHPDLAAQLFQNLSEPLRLIANDDYLVQQRTGRIATRSACRVRVPVLGQVPAGVATWEDIVQDLLSTVAFQRLSMRFTPYVAVSDFEAAVQMRAPATSTLQRMFGAFTQHVGLKYMLASSVLRNVLYHQLVSYVPLPWVAAVLSAFATAPLRLLAYGIGYNDLNFKLITDEGLVSAAMSVAPVVAYSAALALQQRIEKYRKRCLSPTGRLGLMALVKLLLGTIVFPLAYQRNFVYTQPSASRFWNTAAFQAYQLKQLLALLLHTVTHAALKLKVG